MSSLTAYSDEKLLALIARDDEKAFEVLFDRYWELAHATAYSKVGSREVTQEIVLDLFQNFWERRRSLSIRSFPNYLQVSIKYRAITYFNQQLALRKSFGEYSRQLVEDTESTMRAIEYNELLSALEDAVKGLPEKTQEVFRLSRFEGRSVAEIAHQMNLSEKAIEYHITRSRKELRLYLKDFLVMFLMTYCALP